MMTWMNWCRVGTVGVLFVAGCETEPFAEQADLQSLRVACDSEEVAAEGYTVLKDELLARGFTLEQEYCDAPIHHWRAEDVLRTQRFVRGEDAARITVRDGEARADILVVDSGGTAQIVPLEVDEGVALDGTSTDVAIRMAMREQLDGARAPQADSDSEASRAITQYFEVTRWVDVTVDPERIREDGVVTVLSEVHPNLYVAMELTLDDPWSVAELRFDPSSVRQLMAPVGFNGVDVISKDTMVTRLTAPIDDFQSFCSDDEGGGVVAIGQMNVMLDGVAETVRVDLRRDAALQLMGSSASVQSIRPSISSRPSVGQVDAVAGDDMVWVISWFSRDCGRVRAQGLSVVRQHGVSLHANTASPGLSRRCNTGARCAVTLASLVELAESLGIRVPAGATVEMLLELIPVEVGGRCGEIYLFGLIYVGCQCVLHTF
jgi:hypothetical protein